MHADEEEFCGSDEMGMGVDALKLIFEIILFLIPLVVGAKYGPMALIGTAGLSVFIMVEVLRLQPAAPPFGAIFIVLAVICASAAMAAAGGMEFLIRLAGAAMARHPRQIPVIGPLFVWLFTVLSGTGNITFALIPIMYEVSYSAKIRPERILATANAVCQLALMASPVAAVTVIFLALTEKADNSLGKMLLITIPASLIATVVTSLFMARWGKNLDDDPEYQRRLAAGEVEPPTPVSSGRTDQLPLPARAALSAYIFFGGVVVIVVLGFFSGLRPSFPTTTAAGVTGSTTVSMSYIIPMVMFAVAGIIMIVCRLKTAKVMDEPIIGTGLIAALLLLAVPVLAGTVIDAHIEWVQSFVSSALGVTVLLFALILFFLSALIQSQVAAVNVLIPVALSAGLATGPMTGMLGAASGNNLLASIGGLGQSCILTDKTGSTKQGSFLLNGSFFLPMLLSAVIAVAVGLILQAFVY